MSDSVNGRQSDAPPSEITLDGAGLFHLPLCSRDIAVSKHDRIAVVWFHTAGGEQRVGVPIPIEALRELALAAVDAITRPAPAGAQPDHPSE
jgi:hypothetical protein